MSAFLFENNNILHMHCILPYTECSGIFFLFFDMTLPLNLNFFFHYHLSPLYSIPPPPRHFLIWAYFHSFLRGHCHHYHFIKEETGSREFQEVAQRLSQKAEEPGCEVVCDIGTCQQRQETFIPIHALPPMCIKPWAEKYYPKSPDFKKKLSFWHMTQWSLKQFTLNLNTLNPWILIKMQILT